MSLRNYKKKKLFLLVLLGSIFIKGSFIMLSANDSYIPKEGFVPNVETAIKIAEAVWLPIYGKGIYEKKPFEARLKDGKIWIVKGTLKKGGRWRGGVPYIEIQKSDGKILKVIHGR